MTELILFQLPPMLGNLSLSPFCVKVQLALRLKSIPYQVKNTIFAEEKPATGVVTH